jgi:hypothetical protein
MVLVLVMSLSGSLFAATSGVLYPGWGTTLNGKPVYFSVRIVAGDRIQTSHNPSMITFAGEELEMGTDSFLVLGDSSLLECGTIVVRVGKAGIIDGHSFPALAAKELLHSVSPSCGESLPDAPSAIRNEQDFPSFNKTQTHHSTVPAATGPFYSYLDFSVASPSFWGVNGLMFGSSIVSAQLTQNCLRAGACTDVPRPLRSSAAMYGAGLPAAAGVSYFTYYLKSKGYRWWFVPAAVVIGGNIVVSTHAAHYSH